jgi:hypothetical protein
MAAALARGAGFLASWVILIGVDLRDLVVGVLTPAAATRVSLRCVRHRCASRASRTSRRERTGFRGIHAQALEQRQIAPSFVIVVMISWTN